MTGTQTSLLAPTASDERAEETDTAERCDDPTPRGVIRAAFEAVGHRWLPDPSALWRSERPVRVLDVGAGYGAWSSEFRRWFIRTRVANGCAPWPVHITGVEILYARRKHMRKWCDVSITGHWSNELAAMEEAVDALGFDIAIGNPPFDELTGPKGAKRPPEECMPAVLLRHAPAVLLLHTTTAFQKSVAGRGSWRHDPPAATWLVPGGVGFRGPGGGNASDCYQVTLWLRDHTGPCSVYLLDDLPPSARSWSVPPGTEEPSRCESCGGHGGSEETGDCEPCGGSGLYPHGDLPAAPGWQP
jgi:hypothetical protein